MPPNTMSNSYPQKIYVLPPATRQPRLQMNSYVAPPHQRILKRAAAPIIPTEEYIAELLGDDMGPSGPRKRERLTHLTQEEKMDRRKLKNRVAAQNARDKKKERSGKIEDVMRKLVEDNRLLRIENERLRRQNQELLAKQQQQEQIVNEQLAIYNTKQDATIYSNVAYEEEVVGDIQTEDVVIGGDQVMENTVEDQIAFESAEFINAPLPRDKANRSTISTNITNASTNSTNKYTDVKTVPVGLLLTALTMISIPHSKTTSLSTESSSTFKAHQETTIDSLPTTSTMKKSSQADPAPPRRPLLQVPRRRVKHFRRVPP